MEYDWRCAIYIFFSFIVTNQVGAGRILLADKRNMMLKARAASGRWPGGVQTITGWRQCGCIRRSSRRHWTINARRTPDVNIPAKKAGGKVKTKAKLSLFVPNDSGSIAVVLEGLEDAGDRMEVEEKIAAFFCRKTFLLQSRWFYLQKQAESKHRADCVSWKLSHGWGYIN